MRLAFALIAFTLCAAVCAAEIEGVTLPGRARLDAAGPELVLNGAGVRVRLLFKVYVAALYLPVKTDDGEAILRADQPRRLVLHLLRDLSAEQINSSINDALRETLTPEERQPLDARMARFSAIFDTLREIREGTRVTLDYLPSAGTIVSVNAEEKDRIAGADFNQALMRVWLGERPRDPDLRKALLSTVTR